MWIFNNKHPGGKELPPNLEKHPSPSVTVRFLTDEEKKLYGCDRITVRKKVCPHCGELRSDYCFFPSETSADGLSAWCRRCVIEGYRRRGVERVIIIKKGRN